MQIARRRGPCDAGDGAEIFVDGPEIVLRHVVINGPGHYLETSPVEGRRETVPGGRAGTRRMESIHVYARPDDRSKVVKRETPLAGSRLSGKSLGRAPGKEERGKIVGGGVPPRCRRKAP
jgi:hypothetical protein